MHFYLLDLHLYFQGNRLDWGVEHDMLGACDLGEIGRTINVNFRNRNIILNIII